MPDLLIVEVLGTVMSTLLVGMFVYARSCQREVAYWKKHAAESHLIAKRAAEIADEATR